MLDTDAFVTELYVMCDDFCKAHPAWAQWAPSPGPAPSLCPSEVLTLSVFSQWGRFGGQSDFYRFACKNLRGLFPRLPALSQFNRLVRAAHGHLQALLIHLGQRALEGEAQEGTLRYQAMDTTGVATRNLKRRGWGWLFDQASVGFCNRIGWFHGLRLLLSVTPRGAITGLALASGSCKDQPLCEAFLQARAAGRTDVPVGPRSPVPYLADRGFSGKENHLRWWKEFGALVVAVPQRKSRDEPHPWPKSLRRFHAGLRQIIETVNDKLLHTFGLERERPHCLPALQARLLAKAALHNWCILLNRKNNRPDLAFADLWTP